MRLINCSTLELEEFFGSNIPPYAILSHTWGNEEVTFLDLPLSTPATQARAGYRKIEFTCQQAIRDKLKYAWVDTCCIDKRSSSELSEAINSMFAWYRDARFCYAYLSDVLEEEMGAQFRKSRWFTRGWTLQELLAPRAVEFYNCEWHWLGRKYEDAQLISEITRIGVGALKMSCRDQPDRNGGLFDAYCVAKRMSWASRRETTRTEDMAYCLLGIFNINMPLLYGEGDRAFRRLQEEIIRRVNDDSILAWGPRLDIKRQTEPLSKYPMGMITYNNASLDILARSPKDFTDCGNLEYAINPITPPTLTTLGLTIQLPLLSVPQYNDVTFSYFVGLLGCSVGEEGQFLGIIINANTNNSEPTAVISRDSVRDRCFFGKPYNYTTVLLNARHALRAVDQTITIREPSGRYASHSHWRGHVDIVIEASATLWDMGYRIVKPTHWSASSRSRQLHEYESIWDPDTMILRVEHHLAFSYLTELCFEAPLNLHSSTFTVFLCIENSRAIVVRGGTFSDDDKLGLFLRLQRDTTQSDNEDVTIQSQAEHIYRVKVGVRKATVHQRQIFELSVDAVSTSASSSSDVSYFNVPSE